MLSGITLAQSTHTLPYKGFEHNYNAIVTDGALLTTQWYVATDRDGTKAVESTDYDISSTVGGAWSAGDNAWTGIGVYSVDITWSTSLLVGDMYYVFMEVYDAVGSTCRNRMAMEITIAGDFNVLAYNVTGAADPAVAEYGDSDIIAQDCPDDIVNPLWNDPGHTDIGTTTVFFKVERQFSVLAWSFEYSLNDNGGALSGINTILIEDEGGTEKVNSSSAVTGVVNMAADQDYALLTLKMDNVEGATINIDFDIIIANGDTKDADDNVDASADNATYTILPIPVITGFDGL